MRGKSVQAMRRERPVLSTAVCRECGKRHVKTDTSGNVKPSCQGHKHDPETGELLPCENWPMHQRHICYYHGGRTAIGPAHPGWKHGAYSKYLPKRYLHAFEMSLADPELSSMKYQLALLDAREQELLRRLDTNEAGVLWEIVQRAAETLETALEVGTKNVQQTLTADLLKNLKKWASNESLFGEIYKIWELRRKLAETENKREERINAHLTLDDMTKMAAFLAGMLRRYVQDQKALRAASNELSEFFGVYRAPVIEAEVVQDDGTVKTVRQLPTGVEEIKLPPLPKNACALSGAAMALSDFDDGESR